jgi:hypothetical protein
VALFFIFLKIKQNGIYSLLYGVCKKSGRLAGAAERPTPEAVSKDPWRLTPPKNILNEGHFG